MNNNIQYLNALKTFKNILENIEKNPYDNIDEFISNNKEYIYDGYHPEMEDKGFGYMIHNDIVNNKNYTRCYVYEIHRHADICLGVQMDRDCYIDVYISGSLLYEKIYCEKNQIIYFEDPIFLVKIPYNFFTIKISEIIGNDYDEPISIKLMYLYIVNEDRRFIAMNNMRLSTTSYKNGYCTNTTKDTTNDKTNYDFSSFSLDKIKNHITMERIIGRTEKYKSELIQKCWHPSRFTKWCLDLEDIKLIEIY